MVEAESVERGVTFSTITLVEIVVLGRSVVLKGPSCRFQALPAFRRPGHPSKRRSCGRENRRTNLGAPESIVWVAPSCSEWVLLGLRRGEKDSTLPPMKFRLVLTFPFRRVRSRRRPLECDQIHYQVSDRTCSCPPVWPFRKMASSCPGVGVTTAPR
jgi:hypothetical protein